MGSSSKTLIRMLCRKQLCLLFMFIVAKSTFSCKNVGQNNPKHLVALDPRPVTSTTTTTVTTSSTTTTTTTSTTTIKPNPTITGAVKKGTQLVVDWSNGVKMTIMLEDLGDCHLVGSLPWDSEGSVSTTDC